MLAQEATTTMMTTMILQHHLRLQLFHQFMTEILSITFGWDSVENLTEMENKHKEAMKLSKEKVKEAKENSVDMEVLLSAVVVLPFLTDRNQHTIDCAQYFQCQFRPYARR